MYSGRTYLVEAGEPLPFGARRLHLSDARQELPGVLARSELTYSPRAAALLGGYPRGASTSTLLALIWSGRLELHEIVAERALRGGALRREAAPTEPPPVPPQPASEQGWIEVELLTEDRQPVSNEPYRIILPDGTPREGRLNAQGKVRLEGFEPGTCRISFPQLAGTRSQVIA